MAHMKHDWYGRSLWGDDMECARCGTVMISHEVNLAASQSTHIWTVYHKDGNSYGNEPACVEKDQ